MAVERHRCRPDPTHAVVFETRWPAYRKVLVEKWDPHLAGRISLEEAVRGCVAALPGDDTKTSMNTNTSTSTSARKP